MLSQSVEDYLEAIYRVIEKKGYARTSDLAKKLNLKPSSVTGMFKKLSEAGYVNYEKYGGITLTEKGRVLAHKIDGRHKTLARLLSIFGIPKDISDEDACRIEHNVSKETINTFEKMLEFMQQCEIHPKWLKHFQIFCKEGRCP